MQKKVCSVFASVLLFIVCSTHLTLQGYICLFHMEKHNNKAISVTFVEKLLEQNDRLRNIGKPGTTIFWFLVGDWRLEFLTYFIKSKSS